ncbi:hypothetical protein FF2_017623 [Malus domestica]
MGTISNPIRRTASHAIDMYFDLDEALTLPPEDHICYRGNNYNIATSTAYTLAANMPTAVGAEEVNEGALEMPSIDSLAAPNCRIEAYLANGKTQHSADPVEK